MSETLGSLVDKLSIVNIKLFMVQEKVFTAERDKSGLDAETVQKLSALNRQRNLLATEIDELLHQAVVDGKAVVDYRPKVE